jgi:membrane-associated phospholipid phosphatase
MVFISTLGLVPFILIIILGITFAFDFRKGLVLMNIVAWTALTTVLLKQNIDFPRPPDVDTTIKTEYKEQVSFDLSNQQPEGFFEIFSEEILSKTRNDAFERYGFPSGHTSIQVALWLSMMFLFRRKWAYIFGSSIIVLTIISRMYLGAHFLGDTIGGLMLGVIFSLFLLRYIKDSKFYIKRAHNFKSLSFLGFPLLLLPFATHFSPTLIGGIIGINTAAILQIQLMNVPINNGHGLQRAITAIIGILLYLIGFYLPRLIGIPINGYLGILITAILSFASFFGALALCRRINLIRS